MLKKLQLQSAVKTANNNLNIEKAKGRPLLQWVGKNPLDNVQFYPAQETEVYGDKNSKDFNKIFWGDNLQVLSHLLKDYRGLVDLIYIDPPFDSKADYVKKVRIRGEQIEGVEQGLFEEKQYTDIWEKDEYLQFMYERLLLMREILSETGSIYVHLDFHKDAYLRVLMDEVFGESNFRREIIWALSGVSGYKSLVNSFVRGHDTILYYSKNKNPTFNKIFISYNQQQIRRFSNVDEEGRLYKPITKNKKIYLDEAKGVPLSDVWTDIASFQTIVNSPEITNYPTQKPEALIERIINASSKKGDIVMDCFMGSGTTLAVAQRLERRWIGCDINIGAIQTATKRLNQIVSKQFSEKKRELLTDNFKGSLGFKVLNVNDYDAFKNELEAKEIMMEMYGVMPIKRMYFDGILDKNFVKIMPLNRVLNKMDIRSLLKSVADKLDSFTVRTRSKAGEAVYEEGVLVICSGMELDVSDFIKKENKTGVKIEIRDILTDKKNLIFKKKPEAMLEVKIKDRNLTVELKDFYSPILMRKLEIENEKALKKERRAKVDNFKQIIDSIAIDIDYNGKLFNAEITDLPDKKSVIEAKYSWDYSKKGKYTVAIKVIDVLGEEYFETFEINA